MNAFAHRLAPASKTLSCWLFVSLLAGLFAGCVYEAPVVPDHTVPIDPAVLGMWESIPNPDDTNDRKERLLILKYSDTEYVVQYPISEESMYFKAYSFKLEGLSLVQVQLIGVNNGAPAEEHRKYHVVSYSLKNGVLELQTLNTALIDENIKTTKGLQDAIRKNKSDKSLFHDPERFKKIVK